MNNETRNQALEAIKLQHQQWLSHPGTKSVLSALQRHKEEFSDAIQAGCTSTAVTDQTIRLYAVSLKNTEAIIQLLTNTELLINKLNK